MSSASQLNDKQQEAMKYTQGPLLVLAGAGSGKTSVITRKIAHLVQNCRIPAHRITAMTFTNKAAREMKERVTALLSRRSKRIISFYLSYIWLKFIAFRIEAFTLKR